MMIARKTMKATIMVFWRLDIDEHETPCLNCLVFSLDISSSCCEKNEKKGGGSG